MSSGAPSELFAMRVNNVADASNRLLKAHVGASTEERIAIAAALEIVGTIAACLADIACSLREIAQKDR